MQRRRRYYIPEDGTSNQRQKRNTETTMQKMICDTKGIKKKQKARNDSDPNAERIYETKTGRGCSTKFDVG